MANKGRKRHKGMAKRFKVSKRGVVKGSKSGYHHKNVKKRAKRVRQARRGVRIRGRLRTAYVRQLSG